LAGAGRYRPSAMPQSRPRRALRSSPARPRITERLTSNGRQTNRAELMFSQPRGVAAGGRITVSAGTKSQVGGRGATAEPGS
jgi:hypothetical protein